MSRQGNDHLGYWVCETSPRLGVFNISFNVLYYSKNSVAYEDAFVWNDEKDGIFPVKSHYKLLNREEVGGRTDFPQKVTWKVRVLIRVWKVRVLIKVYLFAWKTTWEWIFTLDNLQQRSKYWLIGVSSARGRQNPCSISSFTVHGQEWFGQFPMLAPNYLWVIGAFRSKNSGLGSAFVYSATRKEGLTQFLYLFLGSFGRS